MKLRTVVVSRSGTIRFDEEIIKQRSALLDEKNANKRIHARPRADR